MMFAIIFSTCSAPPSLRPIQSIISGAADAHNQARRWARSAG